MVHGKSPGEMSVPIGGESWTGKSLCCNHSDVLVFSVFSSMALSLPLSCLDRGETLSHERKI